MQTRSKSLTGQEEFKIPPPKAPPDPETANKNSGRGRTTKRTADSDLKSTTKREKVNTSKENGLNINIADNPYETLPMDDDGESVLSENSRAGRRNYRNPPKNPSPPPIVIHNLTVPEIIKITSESNVAQDKFHLQLTQYGTKLFAQSNETFSCLKKKFTEKNVSYFTYATTDEKLDKFVLYGLPRIDQDELKTDLNNLNLKPSAIKMMNVKKPRYNDHCLYMICFPRGENSVTLAQLQQVRGVMGFVVKWRRFQPHNPGVSQCSNCQAFGHGAKNCNMPVSCMKCAGSHKTSECLHNDPVSKKVPITVLKCKNCDEKHSARYKDCEKRIEFLKIREALKPQNRKIREKSPVAAFNKNDYIRQFPSLPNSQPYLYQQTSPLFSSLLQKPTTATNDDLYSPQECFKIFQELYSALTNCKTKAEQIFAISNFTFKYLESAATNNSDITVNNG